jgi:hypothetical protein
MRKQLIVKTTEHRQQLIKVIDNKVECFAIDKEWYPIRKIGELEIILELDLDLNPNNEIDITEL